VDRRQLLPSRISVGTTDAVFVAEYTDAGGQAGSAPVVLTPSAP
jgi:hypothetical protein